MTLAARDQHTLWPGTWPLALGIAALVVLVGGLGVWSTTARLAGAIVTQGVIALPVERQRLWHADGGMIASVHAVEGQIVTKGDLLFRLDPQGLGADLAQARLQALELAARRARHMAERDGTQRLTFPGGLVEEASQLPSGAEILSAEKAVFHAGRAALSAEINLVEAEIRQIEARVHTSEQRGGSERARQRPAPGEHIDLLRDRLASRKLALLHLRTRDQTMAATRLAALRIRMLQQDARVKELRDSMDRLNIRAPIGGVVYGMWGLRPGTIVRPMQALADIVPQDRPLIVSARVSAQDAIGIREGQAATLAFMAQGSRRGADMSATVLRTRAESTDGRGRDAAVYMVDIVPDAPGMAPSDGAQPQPGMPVGVNIQTGARAPLAYLLSPFTDFMRRALRE